MGLFCACPKNLNHQLRDIDMKTKEIIDRLIAAADREEKIIGEIQTLKTEVQDLKIALEDIDLPEEAAAALTRLEETVARADALNADAAAPE